MVFFGGAVYILESSPPNEPMWRCTNIMVPSTCAQIAAFPAGLTRPNGITEHAGAVYILDDGGAGDDDEMWRCADPTDPGACATQGNFPSDLDRPVAITSFLGVVWIIDGGVGVQEMWRCADPTEPLNCTSQGDLPSITTGTGAMIAFDGAVYVADESGREMWRCADPAAPGTCARQGSFPAGFRSVGMTAIGDAPCDIRIARDSDNVEVLMLDTAERILLDATFVDQPAPGNYTYALQMKTSDPSTVCTVYRGQGAVPLPSLLVQVFYGE